MNWPDVLVYTGLVFRGKVSIERIDKTEGELTKGIPLCEELENSAEFCSLMCEGDLAEDDGVCRYFDAGTFILAPSDNGTWNETDAQAIAHVDVPPAVRLFLQT